MAAALWGRGIPRRGGAAVSVVTGVGTPFGVLMGTAWKESARQLQGGDPQRLHPN